MTTQNTTDSKGEALACCLCGRPLTILPNETAYCHNLKPNPSSYDDWKANSCPMARQSTCLPIVVWKALNAHRTPLAAVEGDVTLDSLRALLNRYAQPCDENCDHSQCPLLRELHALHIKRTLEQAQQTVKPIVDRERKGESAGDLMNMRLDTPAAASSPAPAGPPAQSHPFGPCGYQYCDWPDGELRCNEPRLFTTGNRARAIKLLRELRETTNPAEIQRQKDSWTQLEQYFNDDRTPAPAQPSGEQESKS